MSCKDIMVWAELNLYTKEEFHLYLYNFIAQTKLQKTVFLSQVQPPNSLNCF